ncbi:hypothetical protein HPP92_027576 [Vanilla planifolia]|uniref:Uncharacterized protein n=1 Tax=Vanilla planifolia TaxID=51239 RepID=A0A835PAK4_VANPL|nr:hypothetical protein HPP92_027576 [Vanilla planifolia]
MGAAGLRSWWMVVMAAVNKPRILATKESQICTDKLSESAILNVVRKNFKDHLILGEEGGLIGDTDLIICGSTMSMKVIMVALMVSFMAQPRLGESQIMKVWRRLGWVIGSTLAVSLLRK